MTSQYEKYDADIREILHDIARVLRLDHLHEKIDTAGVEEKEVPENAPE